MLARANKETNPIPVQKGDYVYLQNDQYGKGRKLQNKYTGPFVIESIISPHMVTLRNTNTRKKLKNPVHLDRLKMAYIRQPNPVPYLIDKVNTHASDPDSTNSTLTQIHDTSDQSSSQQTQPMAPAPRRSLRTSKVQPLYRDHASDSSSVKSDSRGFHQIKRILGQRQNTSNKTEYLVHIKGEPSQEAVWVLKSRLDDKAKRKIKTNPPPFI